MTDRELLELAAKAAGVEHDSFDEDRGCDVWWLPDLSRYDSWNPLTDDGDALRLAVKLRMKVYPGEAYPWCESAADYKPGAACDEDECPDPCAATRRAIVRAAAEIARPPATARNDF